MNNNPFILLVKSLLLRNIYIFISCIYNNLNYNQVAAVRMIRCLSVVFLDKDFTVLPELPGQNHSQLVHQNSWSFVELFQLEKKLGSKISP